MKYFIIFTIFCATSNTSYSQSMDKLKKMHENISTKSEYHKEIEIADKMIALEPDNGIGYYIRAEANKWLKNYEYSELDYLKCINLQYKVYGSRLSLAMMYYSIKQYKKAIDKFTDLIDMGDDTYYTQRGESSSNFVFLYRSSAKSYLLNNEMKNAINDANYAMQLSLKFSGNDSWCQSAFIKAEVLMKAKLKNELCILIDKIEKSRCLMDFESTDGFKYNILTLKNQYCN